MPQRTVASSLKSSDSKILDMANNKVSNFSIAQQSALITQIKQMQHFIQHHWDILEMIILPELD